eukprot:TRINITY_DN4573_c0_g1_i1.p1 TRINITY_DN4573_c0_g1~~TRINITY_DN4573_c0_g1_i1.p1  ORF type:complete len:509 (+),score=136.94 TRINITY_DN4573_c0_g1_i1:19-1545(+)
MGQNPSSNERVHHPVPKKKIVNVQIDDLPAPENKDPNAWLSRGDIYCTKRCYSEANFCYERAIKLNNNYFSAWVAKGDLYLLVDSFPDAENCYRKALELNTEDGAVWNKMGKTLNCLGKHEEALWYFDVAMGSRPKDASVWYNKGYSLMKIQRKSQKSDRNTDSFVPFNDEVNFALGRYAEALNCFTQAISYNKNIVEAWFDKGRSLEYQCCYKEAIKSYSVVIQLEPQHFNALCVLAQIQERLGNYTEAIKFYDRALSIDPNDPLLWNKKGNVYFLAGDTTASFAAYDKALQVNPSVVKPKENKQYVMHITKEKAKNRRESVRDLMNNAKSRAPKKPKAVVETAKEEQISLGKFKESISYNNQGCFQKRRKDYQEALKCFQKAIEYNPYNQKAWNNQGLTYIAMEQYQEAIKCFKRVIEMDPQCPSAWTNEGMAWIRLKEYKLAIQAFEKAIQLDLMNGVAWNNLAVVYHLMENHTKAEKCLEYAKIGATEEQARSLLSKADAVENT